MKKIVLLLGLFSSVILARAQAPVTVSSIPNQTISCLPFYASNQNGFPVLAMSKLCDNGTALLYNGVVLNGGAPNYTYHAMNNVGLPTTAITTASCTLIPGSAWNVTGVTAATHVVWGWAGDPGGVVGQLNIVIAPTNAGTVVGRACNASAASITPTTQAINWWIVP
jgi:hypothetical protein